MQGRISSAAERMEPEMKKGSGSRNLKQEKTGRGNTKEVLRPERKMTDSNITEKQ